MIVKCETFYKEYIYLSLQKSVHDSSDWPEKQTHSYIFSMLAPTTVVTFYSFKF